MGKRDSYLDYKESRKNWDKQEIRRRRKGSITKKIVFCLLVLSAAVLSAAVYFVSDRLLSGSQEENEDRSFIVYDDPAVKAAEIPQPYGLWMAVDDPEPTIAAAVSEEKWMGSFVDTRLPKKAKGLYITFEGITKLQDEMAGLLDRTELNAIVIDVKDDEGRITFSMDGKLISAYGTSNSYIADMKKVIDSFHEQGIYVIARVVALKDMTLGRMREDLVLHRQDGSVYKDYAGMLWLNPFKQEVLEYLVEIASNCAAAGFDEINFDYIRYPTDGVVADIDLSEGGEGVTKIDAITSAVKYLCEAVKPMGMFVSADVFGIIIISEIDQRIVGQSYVELSKYLDYICPMVYPSHYSQGFYGVDYPDTDPYTMIYRSLMDSQRVLSVIDKEKEGKAVVRPWLQDFTASYLAHYISYGPEEVRTQIEAVYDAGYSEWLLWNASMSYTEDALMTEAAAEEAFLNRPVPTEVPSALQQPEDLQQRKAQNGKYYDSPWRNQQK